jgi:cell division protein FtsZ
MSIKLELPKVMDLKPRLTVIGVGGAGCNAVNNMIASGLSGVDFVAANTDAQALAASSAEYRLQLGAQLTEGLGAGSKPEIGEAAAEEAIEEIRSIISGSHMVFIAAGMGGGTGTGAASVIARVSRELGILTVGVVTKPFLFEGARRMRIAEAGVSELKSFVDTLIVIPNQNLFRIASEKTTFSQAFVMADQVLYSGIACIVDLIIKEGLINLDFADVSTVMRGMGSAMMGTGEASGEQRATIAAEEAIANPLLDEVSLQGAKGILLSIIGGSSLTLYDVDEAASRVRQEVDPEANIIVGATFDEQLGDRVRVSIVASGMGAEEEAAQKQFSSVAEPSGQFGAPSMPPTHVASAGRSPAGLAQAEAQADDDMQRILGNALQPGGVPSPVPRNDLMGQSDAGFSGPDQRDVWEAPGNVLIEEGAPQLPVTHVPPPLPQGSPGYGPQGSDGSGGFVPAPPVDVRRPPGRRMPEVGDFPPVGQRAYRAVEGRVGPGPRERGGWDHGDESPRRGLLGRIADRVRGGHEEAESDDQRAGGSKRAVSDPERSDAASESPQMQEDEQHSELPVFFRRGRNG